MVRGLGRFVSVLRLLVPALALAAVLATAGDVSARRIGTGVFDTKCEYNHSLKDDPLVYPGQPGASHLHDFFGNRLADASSTGASLLAAGRDDHDITTCMDTADFAGYWMPALYRDGQKLDPIEMHIYYRNAQPEDVAVFPVGFGMIAGDAHEEDGNEHVRWECSKYPRNPSNLKVPRCGAGAEILATVKFPKCWNGVDLFLPDQSHVKYGPCGNRHPVRIPELTMIVKFPNDGEQHEYQLSSGAPMTLHADFFNAWDPKILTLLVVKCLNEKEEDGSRRSCLHNEYYPPNCRNFLDDDSDGSRDYPVDSDCSGPDDDVEHTGTRAQCNNGKDDDGDGRRDDREDPGCTHKDDDRERDVPMPQCSDGKDNDRDGKIDYPADRRCSSRSDDNEGRGGV